MYGKKEKFLKIFCTYGMASINKWGEKRGMLKVMSALHLIQTIARNLISKGH